MHIRDNDLQKALTVQIVYSKNAKQQAKLLLVQDGADYVELGGIACHYKPDTIYVLLSPASSKDRFELYHPEGKLFEAFCTWCNETLIPEITYVCQQKGIELTERGLLGDSLGGLVNVYIAKKHPAQWSHLLLQSAAFSERELAITPAPHWHVYQLIGRKEDAFVSPRTGEQKWFYHWNCQVASSWHVHTNLTFIETDDEHLWTFWEQTLPDVLEFFEERRERV
ncbi:hypothetical protein FLK61_40325 [Paenalkalicoccus suaedae]|uniref:Esterase family protein n=2 Tax=Paenalkalicoccus suaedae TaxID=2592382 RepID=A0A859FHM9_9BACI|nr:hypothetical protein FLK61_40325 [Paenalkalicoccus suaedae]